MARKTILVICGTGIATSTMVASKIRDYLAQQPGLSDVQIRQGKVMDVLSSVDADVIVATTQVPQTVKVPVVNAVPLLTGMGADKVLAELKSVLERGS
jgi:PTS system galactitol-specific IIB component